MFKRMGRFTRSALLLSAAQWAWHNRDDIKRELQPAVTRGRTLLADLQARRQGEPLAESPTATTIVVTTPSTPTTRSAAPLAS